MECFNSFCNAISFSMLNILQNLGPIKSVSRYLASLSMRIILIHIKYLCACHNYALMPVLCLSLQSDLRL